MELKEKTLESQTIFQGKVVTLTVDKAELSDGREAVREVVHHPGGAAVLAMDEDGCVILVRQWRYPMEALSLEIPAGKLEPGEDPRAAAIRELEEETGYASLKFESLGMMYATPGYCSEKLYLYLARDLVPGKAHPDDGEFLETERLPLETVVKMVLCDEIHDGKTVAAVLKTWALFQEEL